MPKINKKEIIETACFFIASALFAYWLDTRATDQRALFSENINQGIKKVAFYHTTGERPE